MNRSHRPTHPRHFSLILFLLLSLAGVQADTGTYNDPPLRPFEIDYEISRSGLTIITMKRRLLQTGTDEYRFESHSRPTKTISWLIKDRITEHSRWQYQQQHLRPLHYHYQRSGGKKKSRIELDFDWQQGIVNDSERKPVWSKKIPPHTSDKLLYQLQLMLDLQAGKQTFSYTIADSGKLRHYDFKTVGSETLQLPLGRYETIKLYRNSGPRSTTIWCAPELNYLPIRIEHKEKDGSIMQANATRIKGLPFATKRGSLE